MVARLLATDRRRELVAVLERAAPRAAFYSEHVVAYLLVAAFWGLVLYVALTSALP